MNMLIDAHCFDYATSEGINTYIQGMYKELIKLDHEITFFFAAQNIDKLKLIFGEGENIRYVKLESQNRIYRLLFEFPSVIRKYKIDIAHFQYTSPLIKNCKTIITLHDILFKDFPQFFPVNYRVIKGFLFKLSARRADMLVTVSPYSQDRIAHHYKIDKTSIVVTPNGVSDEFFDVDVADAKQFVSSHGIDKYILYVSRIEPRKNHVALLNAYIELRLWERGYKLVFIGKRSIEAPELESILAELDTEISKNIVIIQQAPFSELTKWYAASDLFVYPSLAEGFGIPPLEAVAAGAPTICSSNTAMGGFCEIRDQFFDPTDCQEIKRMILSNLERKDSEHLKLLSERIRNEYNWRASAQIFADMLTERCKSKRK